VRGSVEFGFQKFKDAIEAIQNLVVPDPNDPVSQRAQKGIPFAIRRIVGVLSAINLDDEAPIATNEIGVIWADRLLSHEFAAAELSISKPPPQQQLGAGSASPKRAGTRRFLDTRSPRAPSPLTPALSPQAGRGREAILLSQGRKSDLSPLVGTAGRSRVRISSRPARFLRSRQNRRRSPPRRCPYRWPGVCRAASARRLHRVPARCTGRARPGGAA
jgi:hypothetical protein